MNPLRMSMTRILPVFILAALLALAGCSDQKQTSGQDESGSTAQAATGPHWSDALQPMTAADLETLIEQNRGKAVFLCFWSVNCPACLDELPVLEKLADRFDPDQLAMILVNMDGKNSVLKQFFQDYVPASTVVLADQAAAGHFRVTYIPKLLLYSASGEIGFEDHGFYPEKMLEALIQKAIKE